MPRSFALALVLVLLSLCAAPALAAPPAAGPTLARSASATRVTLRERVRAWREIGALHKQLPALRGMRRFSTGMDQAGLGVGMAMVGGVVAKVAGGLSDPLTHHGFTAVAAFYGVAAAVFIHAGLVRANSELVESAQAMAPQLVTDAHVARWRHAGAIEKASERKAIEE